TPQGSARTAALKREHGRNKSPGPLARGVGRRLVEITANMVQFRLRQAFDLVGDVVEGDPEEQPEEAGDAGCDKSRPPSELIGNPGYDRRGQDGADVGARVENTRGEGAFLFRKPKRSGLDGGREVAAFTQPKRQARCEETG